jgi:hypothetical protein
MCLRSRFAFLSLLVRSAFACAASSEMAGSRAGPSPDWAATPSRRQRLVCTAEAIKIAKLTHDSQHGLAAYGFKNCLIRFPCDESAISCFSLRLRVSSFFALTTHQMAARRYHAGCAEKNVNANAFFSRIES